MDGKSGAHQSPDTFGGGDHRPKDLSRDDSFARADQSNRRDAVSRPGGGDLHRAEDRPHGRPGITIQQCAPVGFARVERPGAMGQSGHDIFLRRQIGMVGAAPGGRRRCGVSAAVGMKERVNRGAPDSQHLSACARNGRPSRL